MASQATQGADDVERSASGELDRLSNERAFVRAVRVAYARGVDEGGRQERPLLAMRVGPEFPARGRTLQGISVEKLVEVAARIAGERAHEIGGRGVHPLGASARRLHGWLCRPAPCATLPPHVSYQHRV